MRTRLNRKQVERTISDMWDGISNISDPTAREIASDSARVTELGLLSRLKQQDTLDKYSPELYSELDSLITRLQGFDVAPAVYADALICINRLKAEQKGSPLPDPQLPELVDKAFKHARNSGSRFICLYTDKGENQMATHGDALGLSRLLVGAMNKWSNFKSIIEHALINL